MNIQHGTSYPVPAAAPGSISQQMFLLKSAPTPYVSLYLESFIFSAARACHELCIFDNISSLHVRIPVLSWGRINSGLFDV